MHLVPVHEQCTTGNGYKARTANCHADGEPSGAAAGAVKVLRAGCAVCWQACTLQHLCTLSIPDGLKFVYTDPAACNTGACTHWRSQQHTRGVCKCITRNCTLKLQHARQRWNLRSDECQPQLRYFGCINTAAVHNAADPLPFVSHMHPCGSSLDVHPARKEGDVLPVKGARDPECAGIPQHPKCGAVADCKEQTSRVRTQITAVDWSVNRC